MRVSRTDVYDWMSSRLREIAEEKNGQTFGAWVTTADLSFEENKEENTATGACAICAFLYGNYEVVDLEPAVETMTTQWQFQNEYWASRSIQDSISVQFDWAEEGDRLHFLSIWDDATASWVFPETITDDIKIRLENQVMSHSSHWLTGYSKAVEVNVCIDHQKVCQVCEDGYAEAAERTARWDNCESLCWTCAPDYSYCEGSDHWTQNGIVELGSEWLCYDCAYEAGYERCYDCDDWYDANYSCQGCRDEENFPRSIHSYSYKPDPEFGWIQEADGDLSTRNSRRGVLFMGLEIEVECKNGNMNDGVRILQEAFGHNEEYLYLKTDGSLNYGFEIVTHPRTLASHKAMDMQGFKRLADSGFRAWKTDTCGIHVHVNRDGFNGVPHQWRWTRLFANTQNEMTILAGRSSDQWATFSDMKQKLSQAFKFQRGRGDFRYEAINLTNFETFEVRIFKSSLNPARIAMIMELIDATVEYTRHLTIREISDHALEWNRFIDWVISEQSLKYPNLIEFATKYSIAPELASVGKSDGLDRIENTVGISDSANVEGEN